MPAPGNTIAMMAAIYQSLGMSVDRTPRALDFFCQRAYEALVVRGSNAAIFFATG
jgi:hypothetical protein